MRPSRWKRKTLYLVERSRRQGYDLFEGQLVIDGLLAAVYDDMLLVLMLHFHTFLLRSQLALERLSYNIGRGEAMRMARSPRIIVSQRKRRPTSGEIRG